MFIVETQETRSQASRAAFELRRQIIECQFQPGERLHIASLAKEMDVSPGAVREALSRLSSEHLVTAIDQRGFRVNHLSLDDMLDIFETRASIEEEVVQLSVKAGTSAWRDQLREAYERMIIFNGQPIRQAAAEAHEQFHRALVAACPSAWRMRLFNILYSAGERYRNFALFTLAKKRNAELEHERLCEAAMDGDFDLAGLLARRHVERTREVLSNALSSPTMDMEQFSLIDKCR